jgi:hypothetical protein
MSNVEVYRSVSNGSAPHLDLTTNRHMESTLLRPAEIGLLLASHPGYRQYTDYHEISMHSPECPLKRN